MYINLTLLPSLVRCGALIPPPPTAEVRDACVSATLFCISSPCRTVTTFPADEVYLHRPVTCRPIWSLRCATLTMACSSLFRASFAFVTCNEWPYVPLIGKVMLEKSPSQWCDHHQLHYLPFTSMIRYFLTRTAPLFLKSAVPSPSIPSGFLVSHCPTPAQASSPRRPG